METQWSRSQYQPRVMKEDEDHLTCHKCQMILLPFIAVSMTDIAAKEIAATNCDFRKAENSNGTGPAI